MTQPEIERFLRDLERRLAGRPRRFFEEARDHLQQIIEDLRSEGWTEEEALREAQRRFGSKETIADAFAREESMQTGGITMMRTLVLGLASLTSLMAVAIAVHGLSSGELDQASSIWTAVKLVGCVVVLLGGVVTWSALRARCCPYLLAPLAVGMIAISLAGAYSVIELGRITGDYELWVGGFSFALLAQSGLMLLIHRGARTHPGPATS